MSYTKNADGTYSVAGMVTVMTEAEALALLQDDAPAPAWTIEIQRRSAPRVRVAVTQTHGVMPSQSAEFCSVMFLCGDQQ